MNQKNKVSKNKKNVYYLNEFAQNNNKFTLTEEKVLHLVFSKLKPFEKNETTVRISKQELFDLLDLTGDDKYKRYKKLFKDIVNKTIIEFENDIKSTIGTVICKTEWFKNEPNIDVKFNADFMPYIQELLNNYTKVNLQSVLNLKSKHSLTLYKFLCSWNDDSKNENKRYITTKELKELLGIPKEAYIQNNKFNRADFERRVLNKSIDDINKETNITVKVKKNKFGNFVKNYEFNWKQKVKPLKAIESKVVKQDKKIVATMKKPKFITKEQITIDDLEKELKLKVIKKNNLSKLKIKNNKEKK